MYDDYDIMFNLVVDTCNDPINTFFLCCLGDLLKLFVPMMVIYHQYVADHTHAMDVSS